MYLYAPTDIVIANCLFRGNWAAQDAGAVKRYGGSSTIINCTISNNVAARYVGGISTSSGSSMAITNCVLWGNSDSNGPLESAQFGGYTNINYCCVQGWTGDWGGTGNTGGNPRLLDPDGADNISGTADDDLRVASGSPVIDAGDNLVVPVAITAGLDGLGRYFDDPIAPDVGGGLPPIVDMGAYEYQADCNANEVVDSIDIQDGTSDDCDDNGVPDECDPDCNSNGTADGCDILDGTSQDCTGNGVPDECDIAADASLDGNSNGVPDDCEESFLFWSQEDLLKRAHLNGTDQMVLQETSETVQGLDVHAGMRKLYWHVSSGPTEMYRCNLDGSGTELILDLSDLGGHNRGLAIDEINNRVWWCDNHSGTGGQILSAATDGSDRQTVVSGVDEPTAVAVDPTGQKVYWVSDDDHAIWRASLTGSNQEQLIGGTDYIGDIALDPTANLMYWTVTSGVIKRSYLDGTGSETVLICPGWARKLVLDSVCEKVYWTDHSTDTIWRANLDGSLLEEVVSTDSSVPLRLAVYYAVDDPARCEGDCNDNGIPDDQDISDGTSEDCNGDGVPDECEPDCNSNGVADECDITDGTSEDCNENGVPDECGIAQGNSPDDNGDGIPDECQSLLSPDLAFDFTVVHPDVYGIGALNNQGQIVYRDETGLYLVADEAPLLKLRNADLGDLSPNDTRLNDHGQIVVHGRRADSTYWEILRIEPAQSADDVHEFVLIASATGFPFNGFPYVGSLANTGQVAFRAESPIFSTTYIGDGTGGVHDPGSFLQPFPGVLFGPTMGSTGPVLSNGGLVAQVTTVGGSQVVVGHVGDLPPAPTLDDYTIFNNFAESGYFCAGSIAGNDNNNIVFRNQQPPHELILSDGTTQQVLATDARWANLPLSINAHDEVAFIRENQGAGFDQIWLTNGLVEVLVAQTGDSIGGFEAISVGIGPQAYNDARHILFTIRYEESPGGNLKTALLLGTPVSPGG